MIPNVVTARKFSDESCGSEYFDGSKIISDYGKYFLPHSVGSDPKIIPVALLLVYDVGYIDKDGLAHRDQARGAHLRTLHNLQRGGVILLLFLYFGG